MTSEPPVPAQPAAADKLPQWPVTRSPLVSFIVPCYKLAHYLGSCIESLLSQSHEQLEILVIDDCSPDNTRSVVNGYRDDRIRYVRNEQNLGHLRTYNSGIAKSRGDYIWLISADDCLCTPLAVAKYVEAMQTDPGLVYAFCPALALNASGQVGSVIPWTRPFRHDAVLDGRSFLTRLAAGNCISAPSVMVRRNCYARAGDFPLDLPHAGDWYLWCAFAFLGRVAYFDEPLVYYRTHASSMSTEMHERKTELVREDQAKVRWRVKSMADHAGFTEVSAACVEALTLSYADRFARDEVCLSPEDLSQRVQSVLEFYARPNERARIAASIYGLLADNFFSRRRHALAKYFYLKALPHTDHRAIYMTKLALLRLGRPGATIRRMAARLRKPLPDPSANHG